MAAATAASGGVYVYAMAVVSATALVLLAIEQSFGRIFLGLIAVFSFYFAFSGYRVLSRKRAIDRPGTIDWVALGLFGGAGVGILGMGVYLLLESVSFGVVMVVLSGVVIAVSLSDLHEFHATDLEPRAWFFEHLQRMGGAYIATTTAFVSVNATFVPLVARWLLPSGASPSGTPHDATSAGSTCPTASNLRSDGSRSGNGIRLRGYGNAQ